MLNFDQSLSRIFDLLHKGFESTLGANKNWGRWSDIVAVMCPDIASNESTLETILSMRVLEWLVTLVGCRIYGMVEFEARESRNSLVGWCSLYFCSFVLLKSYQVVD